MIGSAYAQSSLPPCEGSNTTRWSNCFGSWTNQNGDVYVGEYKDGKFSGQGTVTFKNGNKYVGEFKDDRYNGLGTSTFANGGKYVGEYKNGNSDGQGAYTFADGTKYVGEFKDGKFNWQGTLYAPDGTVKNQGIWRNNTFFGPLPLQKATDSNGELPTCEGNSLLWNNCIGSAINDGGQYIGEWKKGLWNGKGAFYWNNGNRYVGEYQDLRFHGQGIFIFIDGRVVISEWKEGKTHGRNIEYRADRTIVRAGIYEDGKFIRAENITPAVFTRIPSSDFNPHITNAQLIENQRLKAEEQLRRTQQKSLQNESVNTKESLGMPMAEAQNKCRDLGFTPKTEGYGKCVLQLSK